MIAVCRLAAFVYIFFDFALSWAVLRSVSIEISVRPVSFDCAKYKFNL